MSAVAAKPAAGGAMNPTAMAVGVVMLLILLGIGYVVSPMVLTYAPTVSPTFALMALIGIVIGGVLIGFGTHFVPVGGAPAAMGQAPGIATGVAMLAAGVALVALGVLVGSQSDFSSAVLGGTIVLIGGQVFVSGVNISSQAEMHRTAIQELSESFDNEMKPLVMEFQGKTYELTGSAEEQYLRWRELLRQIYYAETGLDDGTSREEKGAPEKQ